METFPGPKKAVELTPEELAEQAKIAEILGDKDYTIAPHYKVETTVAEPVPTGLGPTEFMHTEPGRSEVITDILESPAEKNAPRIIRSDGEVVRQITKFEHTVPPNQFQISEIPTAGDNSLKVGAHAFTPTMSPEQRRQQRAAQAAKPEEKSFFKRLFGG